MTSAWAALATAGFGVVTTILGIVTGGLVTRRSQDRQRVRDTQAAAYAKFLQEYAKVEINLREAFTANRPNTADWESFNASLVTLSLVAPRDVSAAVEPILGAIEELCALIARQPKLATDYKPVHEALCRGQIAFVNAARRSLDSSQAPLDWVMGGPPRWPYVERWLCALNGNDAE